MKSESRIPKSERTPNGEIRSSRIAEKERKSMKIYCRQQGSAGFTLVELMVVLVVIGIMAAAIIPSFMGTPHDAIVSTAKASIAEMASALERLSYNSES